MANETDGSAIHCNISYLCLSGGFNISTATPPKALGNGSFPGFSSPPSPPGLDFLLPTILLGLVVFVGNVLVCLVFRVDRRLRKGTNKFVISLAASDLLVSVVYIPVYIHDAMQGQQTYVQFIVCFIWFSSILNHCALAYDRFQCVMKPLHYDQVMTTKRIRGILLITWTLPFCNMVSPMPVVFNKDIAVMTKVQFIQYFIIVDLVFIMICTVVIFISYAHLFIVARRHALEIYRTNARYSSKFNASVEEQDDKKTPKKIPMSLRVLKTELRAARLFCMIVVTHFICWLPMVYFNICELAVPPGNIALRMRLIPMEIRYLVYYSFICNSCLNPMLYGLMRREFREGLRKVCGGRRDGREWMEREKYLKVPLNKMDDCECRSNP